MRGWSVSVQVQPDVSCFQAPGQITANSTSMVGVYQTQGCRTTWSYDLYLWYTMKLFFSKETLSGILIKTTKQNKTRGKELPSTSLNYHCLRSISIAIRPSQLKGKICNRLDILKGLSSGDRARGVSSRPDKVLAHITSSVTLPLALYPHCFLQPNVSFLFPLIQTYCQNPHWKPSLPMLNTYFPLLNITLVSICP